MRRKALVDRIPLAPFSAVLMGASVAFFFFAMPMVLLEQGVIASGLPTIVAAAGPPLGATARTLVAGTFALLAGALTWLVITAIDFIGRPRMPKPEGADETQPIDLRVFDVLPPEPRRAPIFAAELVLPAPREEEPATEEARPVESWVEREMAMPEFPADDVLELVDVIVEEEVQAPPPRASVATEHLSIPELMKRLEAGAERRAARASSTAAAQPARSDAVRVPDLDGALRNALEELQRMATR